MSDRLSEPHDSPRTLAGATILQIVPALREEPNARAALDVAHTLLHAGARTLLAGREGPLVGELKAYGGEWIPLAADSTSLFTRRGNARTIESLIDAERVDIIHARCPGAAWSARRAADKVAAWVVTTLPDAPPAGDLDRTIGDLARGDRIIAPSSYAARPVVEHLGVSSELITVILRAVDTRLFDPQALDPSRIDDLRQTWRIGPHERIVLTPGRVAPWNGQLLLPDIARALVDAGHRDLAFVVVGENRTHEHYARAVLAQARALAVDSMFRIAGHCPDLPAALATADVVVVPACEPPTLGRAVAQAQAMGKPVVASDVGMLSEYIVAPPFMPEDVRTGWVAASGDPIEFARAVAFALTLEDDAYRAMCARAREFAKYMFSPDSAAAATQAVYTSLLAREPRA